MGEKLLGLLGILLQIFHKKKSYYKFYKLCYKLKRGNLKFSYEVIETYQLYLLSHQFISFI